MQQLLLLPDGSLPNGLTPERVAALGLTPVLPTPMPAAMPGHTVVELPPVHDGAQWRQQWQQVPIPAPEPAAVPESVSMRQARLALLGAGLLPLVDDAINALPEPPRTAARIEWDYSSEVHRNRPFVQMLGSALGLTGKQLDELFTQAAQL